MYPEGKRQNVGKPREKKLSIIYNGVDAWNDLSPYIERLDYTDAVGSSDTMSISLSDRDLKWSNSWMPEKGDKIKAGIMLLNWNHEGEYLTCNCGDFIVDDFTFSAPPVKCQINGVSSPVSTDFKETKNTKTWQAATVRIIAQEIAAKYGLELKYETSADVGIEKMEQDDQTDSDFLSRLCEKYGLGIKVYDSRLVIWNFKEYFARPAVMAITPDMVSKWSYKSTMQGTYTGARVSYTSPDKKQGIEVMVGKEGRLCNINQKADSEADAVLIGENAILNANRKETTAEITMPPNRFIYATENIQLSKFGKMDGKYFVEKVSHSVSKGAYTLQVSLSRIPKDAEAVPNGDAPLSGSSRYIVETGDTLWALAGRFYGDAMQYKRIYEANKEVIEAAAKKHGKSNSREGHYIWKGTELAIP